MNFADDGVSTNADFGGDLTAGQSGDDAAFELLDPLWGPGFDAHGNGLAIAATFWAAARAMAARATGNRESAKAPKRKFRCAGARARVSRKICPFKTLERQSIQRRSDDALRRNHRAASALGNASPPL
jgi:hypothetical protein